MSTHWELECKDCGATTEWGQSYLTNHIGGSLYDLCNSGALKAAIDAHRKIIELDFSGSERWVIGLHEADPDGGNLLFDPKVFADCSNHTIWPRNEYGDWFDYGEDA